MHVDVHIRDHVILSVHNTVSSYTYRNVYSI